MFGREKMATDFRRKLLALVALAVAGAAFFARSAEPLRLVATDGAVIRALPLEMVGEDAVTIRREDGREFYAVPLARFSPESRSRIAAWFEARREEALYPDLTPDSDITVRFSRGRDDDLNDDGDPDDRTVRLEPSITFRNNEFQTTYRDLEGIVFVIGESVLTRNEMKLLDKQRFTVTLPSGENVRWEGKPFVNRYDPNPGNGSGFGYKYEDYLIVLFNRDGDPVVLHSSRKHFEEVAPNIMKASPRKSYDEDFARVVPESRV
jgi:hypothetical protein